MAKPDEVLLLEARLINLITPQMENMVKNASKGMNRLENNARKTTTKIGNFFKSAGNSITTFAVTFGPAALAVGLLTSAIFALKNAFRAMNEATQDFESTMAKVKAILKPTTEEFKTLEAEAKRLGITTAFTAGQAGQAFVEMGKLGFKAGEIIKSTGNILDLAALSQTGLAESAEVVVKTLNQFNLVAGDSTMLVDLMATAFTSSALDMDKFRQSMKFVGTSARLVGLDLKDTTALLGILADNGIEASQAGTSLNQALIQFTKPGSRVNKLFKEMGIQGADVITKLKALGEANIDVGETFDLLDVRAARAINVIVGKLPEFDELRKKFDNIDGAAKEFAKTMLDTVAGALIFLTSAQEGLGISIGEAFSADKKKRVEIFTALFRRATKFIEKNQFEIRQFSEQLRQFTTGIISFAVKVGKVLLLNFGAIIEVGKAFFRVFAVAGIVLITKAMLSFGISVGATLATNLSIASANARLLSLGLFSTATASNGATIGVSRFRAVLATLNINPVILALTALALGLGFVGIAIRKDAKKGLEDLKKVSDDEVTSLISLRKEFDSLTKAIKESNVVTTTNFKSGIQTITGTKEQIQALNGLKRQLRAINDVTKDQLGFNFENTKAKKITLNLLKKERDLRNEEINALGKQEVAKNAAIQAEKDRADALAKANEESKRALSLSKEGVETEKEAKQREQELAAAQQVQQQLFILSKTGKDRELASLEQFEMEKANIILAAGIDLENRLNLLFDVTEAREKEINKRDSERVKQQLDELKQIREEFRISQLSIEEQEEARFENRLKKRNIELVRAGIKEIDIDKKVAERSKKIAEEKSKVKKLQLISDQQVLTSITSQALGLFLKSAKAQKTIALGEAIINGILSVQKTAALTGFPINVVPVGLATAQAAVNVAAIASQSFRKGGFPKGANAVVRVNEAGQEAILNAEATNTLGTGTIDRLNAGRGGNITITNEISYSPTLNIGQEEGTDIIDALKRDKDNFVEFFEDLGDKGFFTNKIV